MVNLIATGTIGNGVLLLQPRCQPAYDTSRFRFTSGEERVGGRRKEEDKGGGVLRGGVGTPSIREGGSVVAAVSMWLQG